MRALLTMIAMMLVPMLSSQLAWGADTYTAVAGGTAFTGIPGSVVCQNGGLCALVPATHTANCPNSSFYIDMTTADGPGLYATLLTGRAMGVPVTIVMTTTVNNPTKGALCMVNQVRF